MSALDDDLALAALTEITEPRRQRALEHYRLIRAHLEQNIPLTREHRILLAFVLINDRRYGEDRSSGRSFGE